MKVIELNKQAAASNDLAAEALRQELQMQGVFLINLMSAAGSGKTTFISRTITDLRKSEPEVRIGVMEADIASDVDAAAIEALGAESIQVHTGGCCHMDAAMTRESLEAFGAFSVSGATETAADGAGSAPRIIFLENVGNLICPAEFDTGAHRKVMLLSVPEGDDKPLKYPLMFAESDALIITKMDAAPYFDFDLEAVRRRAEALHPGIAVFPVSAKTGEGMRVWEEWLLREAKA